MIKLDWSSYQVNPGCKRERSLAVAVNDWERWQLYSQAKQLGLSPQEYVRRVIQVGAGMTKYSDEGDK